MNAGAKTTLTFGLGALVVPVVELVTWRLCERHPLDPSITVRAAILSTLRRHP